MLFSSAQRYFTKEETVVDYVLSLSVVSDSLQLHGLQYTNILCPWNFPGKNTGVGCHTLLQGIFPTHGSKNPVSPALTSRFFTNCATCGTWLYSSITSKNVASYRRYPCLQQTLLEVQGCYLNRKEVEERTKLPPN